MTDKLDRLGKRVIEQHTLRAGSPESVDADPTGLQRARDLARSLVVEGLTPALVVLVARRGTVILHEAIGVLRPEPASPPVTLDTIYPVASISKPVTATAIQCLAENGLVDIDRPVGEYVPEFVGLHKGTITVRHLLTHTSGIRDELVLAHVREKVQTGQIPRDNRTAPASLALFPPYLMYWHFEAGLDAPVASAPGQEFSYSGYGFSVLGEIVRRTSGRSYADYCRAQIFEPLGMRDTYFEVPEPQWSRVVLRPADFPPLHLNVRERIPAAMPQGGLTSTAYDVAVFGQMILNGGAYGSTNVLSPASVAQMTTHFPPSLGGLGWVLNVPAAQFFPGRASGKAFCHPGSGGSLLLVDPVYELVLVWLSVWLDGSNPQRAQFADAVIDATK